MQVLPGKPVGDVEQIAGGPDHVEQHLLDVLALVVELVPLGLQQVLDTVAQSSHDGSAGLNIASIEHLDPGEVGEGGGDHVLQVAVLHLALKVGHGKGLAVTQIRLGGRPEDRAVRVSWEVASPPRETRGSRRTRLDRGVSSCSPVPRQRPCCGWWAVERLVLNRDVHDRHVHVGRRRVVAGRPLLLLVLLVLDQRLLRFPLQGGWCVCGCAGCAPSCCRCCRSCRGWSGPSWGSNRYPVLQLGGARVHRGLLGRGGQQLLFKTLGRVRDSRFPQLVAATLERIK